MKNIYKVNEEAVKKISERVYDNGSTVINRNDLEELFPELKESEDERIRKELLNAFQESEDSLYMVLTPQRRKSFIAFLEKQGEQKPTEWRQDNVEELTEFENTMMYIGNSFFGDNAGLDPNDTDAIKKQANLLLELVPKQEWSEEDENNILFLTSIIEECFKDKKKITLCGDTVCANFTKEDVIDRLKSLRPQPHWKPSDEQMDALHDAAVYVDKSMFPYPKGILMKLYKQLKKLRKE